MDSAVYAGLGELEARSMIEPIMYFGIGFLVAALIALFVIPLIHGRAIRLTMRGLEAALPLSMAEIQADKDQLRAEFAMSTRRLELNVEQLKNRAANQLAELGKKGDAINRFKIERDAQKVEIIALKTQVEALNGWLAAAGNEVKAESSVASVARQEWPTAELAEAPMDFLQRPPPNDQRHEGDIAPLVPKEWPTAELVMVPTGSSYSLPPNDQRHRGDAFAHLLMKRPAVEDIRSGGPPRNPDATRGSVDQLIRIAREESDFSAELKTVEPSIRVFPKDQLASDNPSNERRTFSTLARFFVAVLIGVGASFAWLYRGDEAKEMVKTWILPPGWLSSVSTAKSPLDVDVAAKQPVASPAGQVLSAHDAASQPTPAAQPTPAPAATATSPALVQQPQLQPVARELTTVQHSAQQLTPKQEQLAHDIATPPVSEQHISHKLSSPPRAKLTPTPETRPKTIEGWTLLEVADDAVVLKGPNGIWRATRGDTVPGAGRVMSVVRWGNRWIVATSRGLISTP
jgi:hypothetical protein